MSEINPTNFGEPVRDIMPHRSSARPESQPLDDGSLTLYKLQQLLPDERYGERAVGEFKRRVGKHNELLEATYDLSIDVDGFVTDAFTTEPIKIDAETPALTNEQLTIYGLPPVDEDEVPIAIVKNGQKGRQSVSLLYFREDNRNSLLHKQLQDPKSKISDTSISPQWVPQGLSFRNGDDITLNVEVKRGSIKITAPETHELDDAWIIRAEPTDREKTATANTNYEKRRRKNRKRAIGAGLLTLASGATGLFADPDAEPSTPQRTYAQIESIEQDAIVATEAAVNAYELGDVEKLDSMITDTAFSKEYVAPELYNAVEDADSFIELEASVGVVFSQFGMDVEMPQQADERYTGLNDDLFDDTKQLSLGMIDFAADYGGLMSSRSDMPQVKIVDEILITKDGVEDRSSGLYIHGTSAKPVVLLSVSTINDGEGLFDPRPDTREQGVYVFGHEYAHDMHLSDGSSVLDSFTIEGVNPEGYEYRESRYGQPGFSDLEVGVDVAADHALDNEREDVAETFEQLLKKDSIRGLFSSDTVLDNKTTALLADLEENYPGVSARLLKKQIENRKNVSIFEKTDSGLIGASDTIRNNAMKLMLLFGVATAGFSVSYRRNNRRQMAKEEFYK